MPAVTWLDVVKTQLAANPGKSVKDVVPEARKEWNLIKSGKHPTKTKGKMVVKRKRKSRKASRKSKAKHSSTKKHKRRSCTKKYKDCLSKKNKKRARKGKSRKSRGESPWIKHVKSVAKKDNISFRDALKVAGKTFKH